MKRIYQKNIQPLPMQKHYRQFNISHGDTRYMGDFTLWQIVNNFDGPYWMDDKLNIYTPDNIFLFPHDRLDTSYTFSTGRTVSIGDRISFTIASNRPEVIEGVVGITSGGMHIVTTDTGISYELQKIIL